MTTDRRRRPHFRHIAGASQTAHPPGHYSPDVRELEPADDREDDWPSDFARAGAEQLLHTSDLD